MATRNPGAIPTFTFDPIAYVIDRLDGIVIDPWSHLRLVDDPMDAWVGTCQVCGEWERACLMSQCGAIGEPIVHEFEREEG